MKISSDVFDYKDLPTKLQVKTELMQLMIHHEMPLVCFKEIFNLAMKLQYKMNFDFATLSHPHSQKTIIKDLKKLVPKAGCLQDFHYNIVEWLWEKKPVQVSI